MRQGTGQESRKAKAQRLENGAALTAPSPLARRILLVEDEPGLVLTLTDRLRKEGYSLEAASTGEEGLERGLSERWDLILLDVMLPGKSGLDVCRDLRQTDVVCAQSPYNSRGRRNTTNSADAIYASGGSQLLIPFTASASGYAGTFNVGVRV